MTSTLLLLLLPLWQARSGRRCTASVYKAVHGGSPGVAACLEWGPAGAGPEELPPRPSTAPPGGGIGSPSRFLNFDPSVSCAGVAEQSPRASKCWNSHVVVETAALRASLHSTDVCAALVSIGCAAGAGAHLAAIQGAHRV